MAGSPGIHLNGLSRMFTMRGDTVTALSDVSLDCPAGSFTALIGPSGCGKSTLLRIALGLDEPDAGHVSLLGKPPVRQPRKG